MAVGDPCRSDYLDWLAQQRDPEANRIPPRLLDEIARELQRQELIVGMLKEIETERDAIAAAENNAKKVQDLVKLKAIGPEIASVLTGEVLYRSFDNRHQVASYASL